MIVTIDGPAGAGKSTVARRLAEKLGFEFLDTGAMYRAVTWAAVHRGLDLQNDAGLAVLAAEIDLRMESGHVLVDGADVSSAIRTPDITAQVKYVADPPVVREVLVELQRRLVGEQDFVTEGRDQGTVAFPDAECKVFLTATPETRAQRRWEQLAEKQRPSVEEILQQQNLRDDRDSKREVGRLMAADDAQELATDGLTLDEVVDRLAEWVEHRRTP